MNLIHGLLLTGVIKKFWNFFMQLTLTNSGAAQNDTSVGWA